jgi:hypothetical protein
MIYIRGNHWQACMPHVEGHLNRPKCNLGYSSTNINIYIGRIFKLSRQGIIAIRVMTTFRTINFFTDYSSLDN